MDTCSGCGLAIAGGEVACQRVFDGFRLRERAELAADYGPTRLTVDVYCVQHPDRYCVSAKSLAAHLTGLCWALERGGGGWGLQALQQWLNGPLALVKPEIPANRGDLTIADMAGVTEAAAYADALDRWARSTWAAYSSLHDVTRLWVDGALARAS